MGGTLYNGTGSSKRGGESEIGGGGQLSSVRKPLNVIN